MNPFVKYDESDKPTEHQIEHIMHKAEGHIFTWCEYRRDEEICPDCKGSGSIDGKFCDACESSGRKL